MKKVLLSAFTMLLVSVAAFAQLKNVTFQVDSPPGSTVYLAGSWNWNNWPGIALSQIAPGKYSTVLSLNQSATYEYLFVYDSSGTPAKEILMPSMPCTNGNAQYTNRIFNLGTNDTGYCHTWATCNTCTVTPPPPPPTPVNVIFQVENPDSTPVYIQGSWNWSSFPGASMSQVAPNKYATTLALQPNTTYEFKFVNGGTPVLETLDPSWPCTNGNAQYTNHVIAVGANDTAIGYVWSSCTPSAIVPPPANVNVKFQVENPDSSTAYLFGSWNNWANYPGVAMTNIGGNKFEATVAIAPNASYQFKYLNGSTPVFETLTAAMPCTNGDPVYTNRTLSLAAGDTTICNNWSSCNTCVPPVPPVNITFQVQGTDSTPVYVFGNWNNWSNFPGFPMTYNAAKAAYETTLPVPANDTIEWLYVNGTGTKEVLNSAAPCTNGNAQYTNRISAIGTTPLTFCNIWKTCSACIPVSINTIDKSDLSVLLTNEAIQLQSNTLSKLESLEIFDVTGKRVFTASNVATNQPISIALQSNTLYIIKVSNGKASYTTKAIIK